MSTVDWIFAIWAGVATAIAWTFAKTVKGAHAMIRDIADGEIEIYRDDNDKLAWRKTNGIPK